MICAGGGAEAGGQGWARDRLASRPLPAGAQPRQQAGGARRPRAHLPGAQLRGGAHARLDGGQHQGDRKGGAAAHHLLGEQLQGWCGWQGGTVGEVRRGEARLARRG